MVFVCLKHKILGALVRSFPSIPVIRQVRLFSELLVAVVTVAFFVCFVWFLFSQ